MLGHLFDFDSLSNTSTVFPPPAARPSHAYCTPTGSCPRTFSSPAPPILLQLVFFILSVTTASPKMRFFFWYAFRLPQATSFPFLRNFYNEHFLMISLFSGLFFLVSRSFSFTFSSFQTLVFFLTISMRKITCNVTTVFSSPSHL